MGIRRGRDSNRGHLWFASTSVPTHNVVEAKVQHSWGAEFRFSFVLFSVGGHAAAASLRHFPGPGALLEGHLRGERRETQRVGAGPFSIRRCRSVINLSILRCWLLARCDKEKHCGAKGCEMVHINYCFLFSFFFSLAFKRKGKRFGIEGL